MERSEAQRPNSHAPHPFVRERCRERWEVSFGVRPEGKQQRNRQLVQPTRSKGQGGRRWPVDPLRVVERNGDGPARRERAQHGQRRHTNRTAIGLDPEIGEEECCLERLFLWSRQLRRDLRERRPQQVAENRVGDLRLDLGGPRGENDVAGSLGGFDARNPERRLTDPSLTLEDESTR